MTTEIHELPEVGEIVVATVTRIVDQGAYVNLDEFNNIQGFLHISEIAAGWIRSVEKFVKVGEKKILLVKRVNTARSEIDLSLKQVSADQKKKKLLELKRNEKEQTLIDGLKSKAGLSQTEVDMLDEVLVNKFNTVYDAFAEIVSKGITVLDGLNLSKKAISAQNFKTAERVLKPVLSTIQDSIEKKGGTFKFTREESKKTRVG